LRITAVSHLQERRTIQLEALEVSVAYLLVLDVQGMYYSGDALLFSQQHQAFFPILALPTCYEIDPVV
jgi:hypothetical protein